MINESIKKLVCYSLNTGLIKDCDKVYVTNRILEVLRLDEYEEPKEYYDNVDLESTLKELLDFAAQNGILENNSVVYRDLFDTKLMA